VIEMQVRQHDPRDRVRVDELSDVRVLLQLEGRRLRPAVVSGGVGEGLPARPVSTRIRSLSVSIR